MSLNRELRLALLLTLAVAVAAFLARRSPVPEAGLNGHRPRRVADELVTEP